jgi:hypothetical protein
MQLADQTKVARHQKTEPPKLVKVLRGDLDWIVMKCLEKDRARRYETANVLAVELQRHLDNEPVDAGPPSTAYRLHKFVRRNRLIVAATAAVVLVLILGIGVSGWQWHGATLAKGSEAKQRKLAEQETQRAQTAVIRVEIERAEAMFGANSPTRAIAYLARLLRQAPTNRVVAERVLSALSSRNFCLPSTPPLRHRDKINSAQFSPNGQWIVTASRDSTAQVWDSRTGQAVGEALRHGGEIKCAQFSPDGRRVVTASLDGTARIWDVQTGQSIGQLLRHDGAVSYADFSPDGRRIVTGSQDKTVRLWDAMTGEPILPSIPNDVGVYYVHFSPNGNELIAGLVNGLVRIVSCVDGIEVASSPHIGYAQFPEFVPSGERLVTLQSGEALVWNLRGKRAAIHLRHRQNPQAAAFSADDN